MENELTINLSPSESDLKVIKEWLLKENKEYNDGFYCNWEIIEKSYYQNLLISLQLDKKIIGFLVFSLGDIYVKIDIMEIHRDYRKKGFGKAFIEKIAKVFSEQNFKAIKLYCEPQESQYFWEKMGFIKFPLSGYSESELTYYKPLIEVSETTETPDDLNKIELWDVEPYQSLYKKPRWCWEISIKNGKLIKPIIQPCNVNWNIRWTMNGKVEKEEKVKYFSKNNSIDFCPFMYIDKLDV